MTRTIRRDTIMKTSIRFALFPVAVVAVAAVCGAPESRAKPPDKPSDGGGTSYDLVVLAPLGAGTWTSTVGDLNEVGKLVGSYEDTPGLPRAFYYDVVAGEYTTLTGGTIALGINNADNIVGADWDAGQALYWHSSTANPVTLSPLPGDIEAYAGDINGSRMACGRSFNDAFFQSGIAWLIDSGGIPDDPIVLPPLPEDDVSQAHQITDVNSDGVALITGFSGIKSQRFTSETAVLWAVELDENGNLHLLAGPLGLGTLSGGYSEGYAVNNDGEVCGESEAWPFLAPTGSTSLPLPGLDNAATGYAADLNENGQIVGELQIVKRWQPESHAVLWENGAAVDLSKTVSLGRWERLENASEINGAGLIAGDGTLLDFESEGGAYLLIPK